MESGTTRCACCSRPVVIPLGQAQRKSERQTTRSILALAWIVFMRDDTEVSWRWLMRVPVQIDSKFFVQAGHHFSNSRFCKHL